MLPRNVLLLCLVTILCGCAQTPITKSDWPDSLPLLSYYEAVYDQDAANQRIQSKHEYLTWVKRFYKGWVLHAQGWHQMTEQLLAGIDEDIERKRVYQSMTDLGQRISAEWAKDSLNRAIFTPTVATWGNALMESVSRNEVPELLDRVVADVDGLLAGEIESTAIHMGRYYSQGKSDFF